MRLAVWRVPGNHIRSAQVVNARAHELLILAHVSDGFNTESS